MANIKKYHDFSSSELPSLKIDEAKKYKRAKFESKPVQAGDVYFDSDNAKPGYYNYRKIKKIDGDIATVEIWDSLSGSLGHEHTVQVKTIQRMVDKVAMERHDKSESVNELAHDVAEEIGLKKVKGGDLGQSKVQAELKATLKKLADVAQKFAVEDSSVPAGGFAGANSATMRSSRSGTPVSVSFNDVHRGGYYAGSTPFLVQIRVGGGLDSKNQDALLKVAKEFLSKYSYESELGKSYIKDTDGTNWSSVMLTAPSGMEKYSVLRSLEE